MQQDVTLGPPPIDRRRARPGCMGCLGRLVLGSLTTLLLGGVAVLVIQFIFYPWAFFLGGHFHPLPYWQGISRVHRPEGDYVLYISLEPTNSGRLSRVPTFKGNGYLCTPRGERFPMYVYARLSERARFDVDGKGMKMEFRRRPWYFGIGSYDRRPRLTFAGTWENPNLIGDDGGSFAAAFLPDGTLNKSQAQYDYYHVNAPLKLPMEIKQVSGLSAFRNDCRYK